MGRPMDDAELARKVADMVADLPPLTDDQVARVARLLAPYATERTNAMPSIRDTATVRPSEPVEGKQRRRRPSAASQPRAVTTHQLEVDPQVMAAALAIKRPGQRLVIVSATEVRLVNG